MRPILPHRLSVNPLSAVLGITPDEAVAFLSATHSKAWLLSTGVFILSDLHEGHRAEAHFHPLTSAPSIDEVREAISRAFNLFQLKVLYAIIPVEGVEEHKALLMSLGFKQDGVLRDHRLDELGPADDLLFSLTPFEYNAKPRLSPSSPSPRRRVSNQRRSDNREDAIRPNPRGQIQYRKTPSKTRQRVLAGRP